MFSTTFVSLAALIAIATAAPAIDGSIVQPRVSLAGSPLDKQLINAANGGFFIGKEPTTTCVETAPCDTYSNQTRISFSLWTAGTGNLVVAVPGGQSVYVLSTGELAYGAPGATAPTGAIVNGFRAIDYFSSTGQWLRSVISLGGSWAACPTEEEGVYRVFDERLGTETGCTVFEISTNTVADVGATAYEFTI